MAKILCIDIGGTRIKAAILKSNITIKELKQIKVITMGTLGWMNNSLPQIINKDHPASLIHENDSLKNYNSIGIGVPLKVINNGENVDGHYLQFGVPKNLFKAFNEVANCDLKITNDSMAWMYGIIKLFQLSSIDIKYPFLSIIFGTGVGLAYADLDEKTGLELNTHNQIFRHLSTILNDNIHHGAKIHDLLGEKFFHDIKEKHKSWTYLEIRKFYTERVIAFIKDVKEANLFNYSKVASIIIGGGNSQFLDLNSLNKNLDKSIYMLNNKVLQIDPDLIPLLGLMSFSNL